MSQSQGLGIKIKIFQFCFNLLSRFSQGSKKPGKAGGFIASTKEESRNCKNPGCYESLACVADTLNLLIVKTRCVGRLQRRLWKSCDFSFSFLVWKAARDFSIFLEYPTYISVV